MTKQALFIHGGGGGAYEADAALAESLRAALGDGWRVSYPRMPNEEEPDYPTWKRIILDEVARLGADVVLVGHSIGASVLIKVMTDAAPHVAGVFLIATPFWHDDDVWSWDAVRLSEDAAERYPRAALLHFYHGEADKTVPPAHLAMYEAVFDFAETRRLPGRDHQIGEDLAEVARDIEGLS